MVRFGLHAGIPLQAPSTRRGGHSYGVVKLGSGIYSVVREGDKEVEMLLIMKIQPMSGNVEGWADYQELRLANCMGPTGRPECADAQHVLVQAVMPIILRRVDDDFGRSTSHAKPRISRLTPL